MKTLLAAAVMVSLCTANGEVLAQTTGEPPTTRNAPADAPLFQIVIKPSKAKSRGVNSAGGSNSKNQLGLVWSQTEQGATVQELLQGMYGVGATRLIVDGPLPEGKFDVIVSAPQSSQKQVLELRKDAIEATFGLKTKRETREIEIYVATVASKDAAGLRPTDATGSAGVRASVGKIRCENVPVASLLSQLETLVKKPFVDETKLKGNFDIEVTWNQPDKDHLNPEALLKSVRQQLGIELKSEKRKMEVIIVRR